MYIFLILKVCTTAASEYYLEFIDHCTPDFYSVFMRRTATNENHYLERPGKLPVKGY